MKKKKVIVDEVEVEVEEDQGVEAPLAPKVAPLEVSFGNGELNILKDKVNEIIATL